ncbi:zinc-finger double-stranded RNA-binding domain-containing protein [Trichoderma breve]|uniref:Zinc-finger double-stranded RNA-binding domain-containing protein n=1 Tax=Trichoderma breve TaxID=2034170 RepID=A0A9W9JRW9_9HYPO|nr:zinc-finger double-stranded RNA-binding domain-containing protein [Trichoderma breve]KAJ4865364.1 zinc-finger double-stranded RNA-binding domain-containing protein [Trichoderma breve]
MPPRHQTLPPAQTSSAKEAQKSFYCNLCSKGYSRMNDYEAHLSSYDHSHKQRLKDMKAMVRDPNAGAKARKAEAKADGMISIKLNDQEAPSSGGGGGGGFKKGGFKKTGFKSAFAPVEASSSTPAASQPAVIDASRKPANQAARALMDTEKTGLYKGSLVESDTEDEGYEVYDPRFPTD